MCHPPPATCGSNPVTACSSIDSASERANSGVAIPQWGDVYWPLLQSEPPAERLPYRTSNVQHDPSSQGGTMENQQSLLDTFEHVVVLMLENRSFDNML